jgi:hypothetical protein
MGAGFVAGSKGGKAEVVMTCNQTLNLYMNNLAEQRNRQLYRHNRHNRHNRRCRQQQTLQTLEQTVAEKLAATAAKRYAPAENPAEQQLQTQQRQQQTQQRQRQQRQHRQQQRQQQDAAELNTRASSSKRWQRGSWVGILPHSRPETGVGDMERWAEDPLSQASQYATTILGNLTL